MNNYCQIAQSIVQGTHKNLTIENFHETSFIYKKTNERLELLINKFKNKKCILSVIGSGDQILNALLESPKYIDAFDISVFPKYFLKLKLAAIQSITLEEYILMFIEDAKTILDIYYDDLYFNKISTYLDKESKLFWDYLFNYNDWYDIYNSPLFSSEPVRLNDALKQNKYLSKDGYKFLKDIIPNTTINYIEGNILDLNIPDKYDLIYLSNIIQYVDIKEYSNLLKRLTDSEKSEVITTVFGSYKNELDQDEKIPFDGGTFLIHKKT